jgi:hypothetical protein
MPRESQTIIIPSRDIGVFEPLAECAGDIFFKKALNACNSSSRQAESDSSNELVSQVKFWEHYRTIYNSAAWTTPTKLLSFYLPKKLLPKEDPRKVACIDILTHYTLDIDLTKPAPQEVLGLQDSILQALIDTARIYEELRYIRKNKRTTSFEEEAEGLWSNLVVPYITISDDIPTWIFDEEARFHLVIETIVIRQTLKSFYAFIKRPYVDTLIEQRRQLTLLLESTYPSRGEKQKAAVKKHLQDPYELEEEYLPDIYHKWDGTSRSSSKGRGTNRI